MGHPDGAHTHGSGGFDPMPALVVIGVILAGPAVLAALVEIVQLALIIAIAVAVAAVAGLAAVIVWRVRHQDPPATQSPMLVHRTILTPRSAAVTRPAPVKAIEAPQLHVHYHGADPADAAAVIRQAHDEAER
jgi:hypothetical protein